MTQVAEILGKAQGSVFKIKFFVGQKSIFRQYYIQGVKDEVQIQVHKISRESATHISFFRLKLRKLGTLRFRQNDDFLLKHALK